jgi:hypothetical protein
MGLGGGVECEAIAASHVFANRERFSEPIEGRVIDSFKMLSQLEIEDSGI